MDTLISDDQWLQYTRDGFLKLGKLVNDEDLAQLQTRIDEVMLGKASLDYSKTLMQLDGDTGAYDNAGPQTKGHKGATLNYRKIQDLEFDPIYLEYMQRPIFKEACDRTYGKHVPVACFRAMFMNKPAHKGTYLPWHQDRWTALDRDPLLTIWTALNDVTVANGAVKVIPGSHRFGVLNPSHGSGFLTEELAGEHAPEDQAVYVELEAGEVVLLHNWLLHASDVNKTDVPRRAFSTCYMDARSVEAGGRKYPILFGEGALDPDTLSAVKV